MTLRHDEIIEHTRHELAAWLSADGNDVPQHRLEAEVDRMLPVALACLLSHAMTCSSLAETFFDPKFKDRGISQLWNW